MAGELRHRQVYWGQYGWRIETPASVLGTVWLVNYDTSMCTGDSMAGELCHQLMCWDSMTGEL